MFTKRILKTFFAFCLFFFISVTEASAQSPDNFDCNGGFSPLFSGTSSITYKEIVLNTPSRIVAHIVKVDITDNNIYYTTTPRQYLGTATSAFLGNVGAALAINGSGFVSLSDPLGLNSYRGDVYSTDRSVGIVASIDRNDDISIMQSQPSPIWSVVSGVNVLVMGGQVANKVSMCSQTSCLAPGCGGLGATYCTVRPRTLMGINSNTLIMIAVNGDLPTTRGASFLQGAQMLRQCGALTGMNMDGGGSTTMVAQTPNATGRQFLNTLASGERTVSNHFGVCIGPCTVSNPSYTSPLPEGEARPRYNSAQPYPFPCNKTAPYDSTFQASRDNEFHSLRPYQGSPCDPNAEDLAIFCGNDLFVTQNVTVTKNFNNGPPNFPIYSSGGTTVTPNQPPRSQVDYACKYCEGPNQCSDRRFGGCDPGLNECETNRDCSGCHINSNGTETCSFTITNSKNVAVDVSGAELPIMGYTEPSVGADPGKPKVINAYNPNEETVDNATKVNEYVSWYLNGIIGRAEYPYWDPGSDCMGKSTGRPGTCSTTRVSAGQVQCLNEWPAPISWFAEPYYVPWIIPDGKEQCAGQNKYCCVHPDSQRFPGHLLQTDYSGPVKKLLPFSIQNMEKVSEINDAVTSVNTPDPAPGTPLAGIRHNQVVGCAISIPFFNVFGLNIDFGSGIPAPCYRQWQLSDFNSFTNIVSALSDLVKRQYHLADYNGFRPPIEEDYLGQDFSNFLVNYKSWRGNTCIAIKTPIPLIGTVTLCFNFSLINPAVFGNLFPYAPLSSTEDRLGDIRIKSAGVSPISVSPNFRIISVSVTDIQNANLFVPHMEETYDLSTLLQKTFAYKDAALDEMPTSGFIPESPYCSYREVRNNPGDDLFAGTLRARINYTAQVFCTYFLWGDGTPAAPYGNLCENLLGGRCLVNDGQACDTNYGQYDCELGRICVTGTCNSNPNVSGETECESSTDPNISGVCVPVDWTCTTTGGGVWSPGTYCNGDVNFKCAPSIDTICTPNYSTPPQTQSCTNQLMVNMKLETRTPLANEVWTKLVVGSTGIFRKMFPKIGGGNTIEGIYDMPASSQVGYSDESGDPIYAGDPTNQTPGDRAQIYFPHIGGIKEYFLTGIQTLLRPKGYGTQPLFCEGRDCVEGNLIPSVSGNYRVPGGKSICEVADEYNVPCEYLRAIWFIETGNATGCGPNSPDGPMAITDGDMQYINNGPVSLDRCNLSDAWELAARTLLWKKYINQQGWQTPGAEIVFSFDKTSWDLIAVGQYNQCNECKASAQSQYRWGTGRSYCDAAIYLIQNDFPFGWPWQGDRSFIPNGPNWYCCYNNTTGVCEPN
ncbi:MAG: Exopolysaccharide biosynthesis protein N-acetylglucosamine-1-phosphodiester alpha-N-acetylglucosaminidase [Candidatus Woesebacteria bacterium GW2011_GWA1_39_21]|uniref:Exopolysaccharide biosynthesis protein N-acetylglucosamine-1-phosphodiester alpha-N-acetylglucosaminidase n=1 Tax=Candidatus Woesebacteria bacterium GW2011_GWA1_39_21 TaxID=1618550 RepID=A0A0G0N747_9BACT|nr:MAG: Exopolysaccharide biosynthesis protein N-acetylglucosamine-1-phosphodiester alpha-N-acetylglucosaminidase [Candidatus Woesebacteria bacterium GW2011_GWA1_39_21]